MSLSENKTTSTQVDGICSGPSSDGKMNSNEIRRARTFLGSECRVHGLEGLADPGPEGSFLLEQGVQMVLFFVVVHLPEGHGGAWRVRGWAREEE
jgi:hypothetical protein